MAETRIPLPSYVEPPFGVFVNGVPLEEGSDFRVDGSELVVARALVKGRKLGFWQWFLGAWGIGTYAKNDLVDIRYTRDGVAKVLHDVEFEGSPDPEA